MVRPGVTAAGPARAVAKSHGLVNDPSPDGEPVGDTKKSSAGPAARSTVTLRVPGALLGATESCSAQEVDSKRNAAASDRAPGPERDSICPASEGIDAFAPRNFQTRVVT